MDSSIIPFKVDKHSGEVKTSGSIDYELATNHKFFLKLSNPNVNSAHKRAYSTSTQWSNYCLIKLDLNVNDLNDNVPEFAATHHTSTAAIQENSASGVILTQIEATDNDSQLNSVVQYSLLSDQNSKLFTIDSASGLITLNTSSTLNRESVGAEFILRVNASNVAPGENGVYMYSIKDISVHVIDENDNGPQFKQTRYYVSVEENLPAGTVIIQLEAEDPDQTPHTEYFLLNEMDNFSIEKSTGKVKLERKLDFEVKQQYVLDIIAVDPELKNSTHAAEPSAKTQLIVDVLDLNDNEPVFDPSTPTDVYMDESMPVNTTICYVKATDADQTNELTYQIVGQNSDLFGIEPKTGRLYSRYVFDHEKLIDSNEFQVKIECVDNAERDTKSANVTLTIHIRDINDNAPVFVRQNQTVIIKENYPIGNEITKIDVYDLDGKNSGGEPFTFTIMEQFRLSDDESRIQLADIIFSINRNGSLILVKKPLKNQSYLLRIRCYDVGLLYSDTYLLVRIVDASSNEPRMADSSIDVVTIGGGYQQVFIGSDQVIGELKASDADRQDILYYEFIPSLSSIKYQDNRIQLLKSGSDDVVKYFDVNKLTGLVKAKQALNSSIEFKLRASVTDKKFVTESMLNISVEHFDNQCLQNSLFAKFLLWPLKNATESITIEKFVQHGYLKKFKENVNRVLNANTNQQGGNTAKSLSVNSQVHVLGLRYYYLRKRAEVGQEDDEGDVSSAFESYLELADEEMEMVNNNKEVNIKTALFVEVLFTVKPSDSSNSANKQCLNAKPVSKQLNKKRNLLMKRMQQAIGRGGSTLKLKLIDMSFNRECLLSENETSLATPTSVVCSTNIALQDCRLKFVGYNQPIGQFCESSKCMLLPKYEWMCESFNKEEPGVRTSTQSTSTSTTEIDNDEIVEIEFAVSSGQTTTPTTTTTSIPVTISSSSNRSNGRQNPKQGHSCKKPNNPCQNNAVCKQFKVTSLGAPLKSRTNATKIRIHCFCPSGFRGKYCEQDVNECLVDDESPNKQQPCIPEATCINTHGSFICNCSLTPQTLCYNQQAPKYSASVVDLSQQIRNYKNSQLVELDESGLSSEEYEIGSDPATDRVNSNGHITFLGTQIPNHVIQNAILGIFGGLCALLIVLSILAAVVCKVNMSKRKFYHRNRHMPMRGLMNDDEKLSSLVVGTTTHMDSTTMGNTSNTSVDHDAYTAIGSATSSPYSIRPSVLQQKLQKSSSNDTDGSKHQVEMMPMMSGPKQNRFFRNSKARGSMTVSLLSNDDKARYKNKKGGYFNIFKSKLNQNK